MSDDRRVRTVTKGVGAIVTGTVGTVVRSVESGVLDAEGARDLVRDPDRGGTPLLKEAGFELLSCGES